MALQERRSYANMIATSQVVKGGTRHWRSRLLIGAFVLLSFPLPLLAADEIPLQRLQSKPADVPSVKHPPAGNSRVENPSSSEGGAPAETLDEAERRTPQVLRHRQRAVTLQDFQPLAPRDPQIPVQGIPEAVPHTPEFLGAVSEEGEGQRDLAPGGLGGMSRKGQRQKDLVSDPAGGSTAGASNGEEEAEEDGPKRPPRE